MTKSNIHYFVPKTAEVRHLEWEQLTLEQQVEQQRIDDSYIAEWNVWGEKNGYGPGFGGWLARFVVSTVAGIALGPAAILVGAAVWGVGKLGEKLSEEDEDAKKLFSFIGGCGGDMAVGGIAGATVGKALEVGGASLGSEAVKSTAKSVSKTTDRVAGKVLGRLAAREIAKGGSKEACVSAARETTKLLSRASGRVILGTGKEVGRLAGKLTYELASLGFAVNEISQHMEHLEKGVKYKSDCKVCKA